MFLYTHTPGVTEQRSLRARSEVLSNSQELNRVRLEGNPAFVTDERQTQVIAKCPNCGKPKIPDTIGHKHTGHLCFYCGYSTDRNVIINE